MKSLKKLQKGLSAASLALLVTANATYSNAYAADPIVLRFSTVGDSRQDPVNLDPSVVDASQIGVGNCPTPSGTGLTPNPGLSGQDCKWLQSTKAWNRILRTIQSQAPKILFFNGDMIMGYGKAGVPVTRTKTGAGETAITSPSVSDIVTSDLMQFYQQYGFWRGMVANLMEKGTYVVPVPGNHETQCKRCGKAAQVENENAWRDNMGDLVMDNSRFNSLVGSYPAGFDVNNTPAIGSDGITTDQKQMSFSFDVGDSHFAVINTDPVGNDGHAPTTWLDNDLTAAEGRGAKHMFVFGHKPAYFYLFSTDPANAPSSTSSLWDKDNAAGDAFWNVVAKHKATYFCGHEHIYHAEKFNAPDGSGNAAYQVLVGAGGSPFESSVATGVASDRMYSWATIDVRQSGKVIMRTFGYDENLTDPVVKIDTIDLTAN